MPNFSRLEGVNMMLAEAFIPRVSALDSTGSWPTKAHGSSPEGTAEYFLDLYSRRVCSELLDTRCKRNQPYNTGGGTISLGTRVIGVKGKAALENRDLRVDHATGSPLLYDNERGTTTFEAGTYSVDVWEDAPFEEMTLAEQQKVLSLALPRFAMQFGGSKSLAIDDNDIVRAEMQNTETDRKGNRSYRQPLMPQPKQ